MVNHPMTDGVENPELRRKLNSPLPQPLVDEIRERIFDEYRSYRSYYGESPHSTLWDWMDEPNGVGDETYGDDCFEIMDEIVQKYLGPYSDADADACQWYWMEGVREHEPYIEDLFDTKCRDVPQPVAT